MWSELHAIQPAKWLIGNGNWHWNNTAAIVNPRTLPVPTALNASQSGNPPPLLPLLSNGPPAVQCTLLYSSICSSYESLVLYIPI